VTRGLALVCLALGTACRADPVRAPGARLAVAGLTLDDWRATNSVGTAGASLFGRVASTGADTLLAIASPASARITLHRTGSDRRMHAADGFPISPDAPLVLQDGGRHAMMEALAAPLKPGDSLDVTLRFARAGSVTLRVPVVRLTEASRELR
jgi:copper(I)-binding protein